MFNYFNWKMSTYWPIFDDGSSTTILVMEDFHDYTMLILVMITLFLMITIMQMLKKGNFSNPNLLSSTPLEVIWTVVPMVILVFIAYPSLYYLYLSELSLDPSSTIKIFGAQWYWIYEYSDFSNFSYSSYMLSDEEILTCNPSSGGWRLLECDNRGVLPFGMEVRVLVTSQDVIHSFSIPSLGIKVDAVPGRLNWTTIFSPKPGTYYGQCTEICGVGHAFMPISIDFVSPQDYFKSLLKMMNS